MPEEKETPATVRPGKAKVDYIDTSFENASPLWYEGQADGTVKIHLVYDQERGSPNRAAGHIHFAVEAKSGTEVTLEFTNLDNVWNGQPGSIARELKTAVVSEDGKRWTPKRLESLPGNRIQLRLQMPGPYLNGG
jgi:hypothetical protein